MLEDTKKEIIKSARMGAFYFFAYFIVLLLIDILIFVKTNISINSAIITRISLFNFANALILCFVSLYFKRLGMIISEIIMALVLIISLTEILVYETFDTFMLPNMLINNAGGVMTSFGYELKKIVFSNLLFLVGCIIFFVVFIILISKFYVIKMDSDSESNYNNITNEASNIDKNANIKFNKMVGRKKIIILNSIVLVSLIVVLLASIYISVDASNFSQNVCINGLKLGLIREVYKSKNELKLEDSESVDVKTNKEFLEKYNVLDIDYKNLDVSNLPDDFKKINQYISERAPSNKNEWTGIFKGKNLIMICAEAFSSYIVDKELTPTLYRLINNGFKFTDYYVPSWGGSTITGEYAFLTGLIPKHLVESLKQVANKNMYFTLPRSLKREGYNTGAYHNGEYKYYERNVSHGENLGFDYYLANGNGIEKVTGPWPNDIDLLVKTIDDYHDKTPFCMYYMTVSGHAFYNDGSTAKVLKNINRVKERYEDKYPDQINNYIAVQLYIEDALTELIKKLEEYNLINDTVICMTSDHYPYGLYNNAFTNYLDYLPFIYGKENMILMDKDKNMPILWCGSLEKNQKKYVKEITKPTSSIDLTPTLLNLFGVPFDSRLLAGRDAFSNFEGLVPYNNGTYITLVGRKEGMGIKTFKTNDGSEISEDYIRYCDNLTDNLNILSKFIADNDYYDYLFANENYK